MCIGMPLQVVASEAHLARCEAWSGGALHSEQLDMALVGPQPVGTWVLAFQGAARQLLSAREAEQALAAREALAAVLHRPHGAAAEIEHFFADLVGRTPELPAHLRPTAAAGPETPIAVQP